MLHDAHLGIDCEVDVVVEGTFDGEPVTTSIEVIERGRTASVTWVQEQIARHRYLPTNRLVLISKSGFTKNAVAAVAREGGWVEALTPQIIEVGGHPVIRNFFVDLVQATPASCQLLVQRRNGEQLVVSVQPDYYIYDNEGAELGTAGDMVMTALGLEWVSRQLLIDAHNHPQRENLRGLVFGLTIGELGYHLREGPAGEMQNIVSISLQSTLQWSQTELLLTLNQLGSRRFESGKTTVLGREVVWVASTDEQTNTTKVSWGTGGHLPHTPAPAPSEPPFAALRRMPAGPRTPVPFPLPP